MFTGGAAGWDSNSSTGVMSNADDTSQSNKHSMKLQERVGAGNQLSISPGGFDDSAPGPGSLHNAHSASLSSLSIQEPGFPMSPGASSIISTSSWATPRSSGTAKRWGALKNLGSLQAQLSTKAGAACPDGQSIQDEKENSANQGSSSVSHELPTVKEPSLPQSSSPGAASGGDLD